MMDQPQSMREEFGRALVELGKKDKRIVALSADLTKSTGAELFADNYPDRFIEVGVAEQNMIGIATGMALEGKTPFATSYSCFVPARCFDHIRISICYNNANVKLVSSHAGITTGADGATHQMLEDIALMRSLPKMTVVVPADARQAYIATKKLAEHSGPSYLRLCREPVKPIVDTDENNFKIGKADILIEGDDVLIVSCGIMVYEALSAAMKLKREGIMASVINCHTIKPLDKDTIFELAKEVRGVVVAEEAQINGGLGDAIAQLLGRFGPKPIRYVAVRDKFGQSGEASELKKKYHLQSSDIVQESLKAFRRVCD